MGLMLPESLIWMSRDSLQFKKCAKIIAEKGKKIIGRVVSGERGTNTTIVAQICQAFSFHQCLFLKENDYIQD